MNSPKQRTRTTTCSMLNIGGVHSSGLNDKSTAPTNVWTDGGGSGNITPTNHLMPLCIRFSPTTDSSSSDQDRICHGKHLSHSEIQNNGQFHRGGHFWSFSQPPSSQGCRKKLKSFFGVIPMNIWTVITHFVISVWLVTLKRLPAQEQKT